MYKGNRIGVVVPAFNEEAFVGEVIATVPAFVDRVYVVDDGSTDGTWAEIQRAARETNERATVELTDGGVRERRVVPIQHAENRGVGGAIKTGYLRAREDRMDVTAVMGGDAQMDPDLLDRIVDPVAEGRADYAKGNRLMNRDVDGMSQFRLVGNTILTVLTKIASGYWGIGDPQNGYSAISLDALETVGIEEMYEFYGYCNDLLVRLNVHRMRVADVPAPVTYGDETSHISYGTYVPKVSLMLFRTFLWRLWAGNVARRPHPLAACYGLGMAGGLAALVDGLRSRLTPRGDGRRSLGLLLASTLVFVLGAVLDAAENDELCVEVDGDDE